MVCSAWEQFVVLVGNDHLLEGQIQIRSSAEQPLGYSFSSERDRDCHQGGVLGAPVWNSGCHGGRRVREDNGTIGSGWKKCGSTIGRERKDKGRFLDRFGERAGCSWRRLTSFLRWLNCPPTARSLIPPLAILVGWAKIGAIEKYHPLWLGKSCESGIDFFARNMASQVALGFA